VAQRVGQKVAQHLGDAMPVGHHLWEVRRQVEPQRHAPVGGLGLKVDLRIPQQVTHVYGPFFQGQLPRLGLGQQTQVLHQDGQ
jgi:hypothetical protein